MTGAPGQAQWEEEQFDRGTKDDYNEWLEMQHRWREFRSGAATTVFSVNDRYRYALRRNVKNLASNTPKRATSKCLFVMLNPSTANEVQDDPTVRRCMVYAARWGYETLLVANIFAYRSPHPAAIYQLATERDGDPIGPDNDQAISELAVQANRVICAWGNDGSLRCRGDKVHELLANLSVIPYALGVTKIQKQPSHPLYLPAHRKSFRLLKENK